MRVLGIDPGINATGYGLIDDGRVENYGLIKPEGDTTSLRIRSLYEKFSEIIENLNPDIAAVEEIIYNKNPKSFYLLGLAKGVILLALEEKGIEIHEIPPTRVKLAVTGNGRAKKDQVAYMVKKILGIEDDLKEHITDALACALVLLKEHHALLDKG